MVRRIIKAMVIAFIFFLLIVIIATPFINDKIATDIKKDLLEIPLPLNAELVDSISYAGKLTGNGNGMQYFGAILIKSDLSLDDLEAYYAKYHKNEWSCCVKKQTTKQINFIEHADVSFRKPTESSQMTNYYIVYTWGDSKYFLSGIDLRGH